MLSDSLRDLELAGVRWELSENQEIFGRAKKETAPAADIVKAAPNAAAVAAVIPPLAPVATDAAADLATGAADLAALTDAVLNFNHPLKQFVKNVVRPHFAPNTNLLIITDAPSTDDDQSGQILTGAAGALLDKMLAAIGLQRTDVSILPLIFWRTPGGRTPTREELDLARPFVTRAIDLVGPRAILTLGTLAALEIADAKLPKDHGVQFDTNGGIPALPIFHPNYLILKPDAKRDVWDALKKLQNILQNGGK